MVKIAFEHIDVCMKYNYMLKKFQVPERLQIILNYNEITKIVILLHLNINFVQIRT